LREARDVLSLRRSEVIYKNKQIGLRDFLSLAKKKNRECETHITAEKTRLRDREIRRKFCETHSFEGPYVTPCKAHLQINRLQIHKYEIKHEQTFTQFA